MTDPRLRNFVIGKIYNLALAELSPDPDQPRKHIDPDEIETLAASIREHGVLQPILFRVEPETHRLLIVSGERRYEASRVAGKTHIPAILTTGAPAEVALVENLLREDLTAMEEAEAFKKLKEEHGYADDKLASAFGKGRSTVTEILTITGLPDDIRDIARANKRFSRRQLLRIARIKDKTKRREAFTTYQAVIEKKTLREKEERKKLPQDQEALPAKAKKDTLALRAKRHRVAEKAFSGMEKRLSRMTKKWTTEDISVIRPKLEAIQGAIAELLNKQV